MEKSNDNTKQISNRLSRIIGQLQAVKRMNEEKRACSEVLIQISAARSALDSTTRMIIQEYINSCIYNAIEKNDDSALDNLNNILGNLF